MWVWNVLMCLCCLTMASTLLYQYLFCYYRLYWVHKQKSARANAVEIPSIWKLRLRYMICVYCLKAVLGESNCFLWSITVFLYTVQIGYHFALKRKSPSIGMIHPWVVDADTVISVHLHAFDVDSSRIVVGIHSNCKGQVRLVIHIYM